MAEKEAPKKLGLFRLTTTIITLVVGAGVFTLSGDMAQGGAGTGAVMTAWGIAAVGVLALLLCFFALSRVKPHLVGGIYSYADAGFGPFAGFCSAWGYWLSALFGNMGYCVLLFGALGYFFPVFGDGTTLPAVLCASGVIWFFAYLVSRGVHEVSGVNAVIAISKIVPILVAVVAIMFLQKFDLDVFLANMSGDTSVPFIDQVRACMAVTVWTFIGVEGAVAISGRARKSSDVGRATLVAFACVLVIYLMVSFLSMGVLSHDELAALGNPAFAGVVEAAVGPWGATLINLGVIISIVGAMLGFTLLACESPYEAALQGVFPRSFTRTNKHGAPVLTLLIGSLIVQVFLLTVLFSDSTYQLFYTLSASMILLPYLLSSAYLAKVAWREPHAFKTKVAGGAKLWCFIGIFATLYSIFLYYSTGINIVIAAVALYAPGAIVYYVGARGRNFPAFGTVADKITLFIMIALLVASLFLFATGGVTI